MKTETIRITIDVSSTFVAIIITEEIIKQLSSSDATRQYFKGLTIETQQEQKEVEAKDVQSL